MIACLFITAVSWDRVQQPLVFEQVGTWGAVVGHKLAQSVEPDSSKTQSGITTDMSVFKILTFYKVSGIYCSPVVCSLGDDKVTHGTLVPHVGQDIVLRSLAALPD